MSHEEMNKVLVNHSAFCPKKFILGRVFIHSFIQQTFPEHLLSAQPWVRQWPTGTERRSPALQAPGAELGEQMGQQLKDRATQ